MSLHSRNSLVMFAVSALALPLISLTGCGIGTEATDSSAVTAASITGHAMGGQSPIVGGTVSVVAVGSTGYGAGAVTLASVTSTTGGNFAFSQDGGTAAGHYSCPSNNALLYLTVTSGDPTGVGTPSLFNPAIKFVSPVGACSKVGTGFFVVNEVTTVATAAALQQYIDPVAETIGAPSTGSGSNASSAQTGIANAFATAQNLVNLSTGNANSPFPPTVGGFTIATPEYAKINTEADILASCVNTSPSGGTASSACTSLLAAATPPTVASSTNFPLRYATTPTAADTFQAALFMQTNPTDAGTLVTTCNGGSTAPASNLACLYSLAAGTGAPFVGVSTQPTDWTVGITYSSANTEPVNVNGTVTAVPYLGYPQYLAIDKTGNVYVANGISAAIGASLTVLNPTGSFLASLLYQGQLIGPRVPVIDPSGAVWVPNFGSNSTGASNTVGYATTVAKTVYPNAYGYIYNVGGCPYGLASDGAGNIFVGECSSTFTNGNAANTTPGSDLRVIPAGAGPGTTATVLSTTANGYSAGSFSDLAVDSNFNVWTTSGGSAPATTFVFSPGGTGAAPAYNATPASISTGAISPEAIAIDKNNNAFVASFSTTAGQLSEYSFSAGAITAASNSPFTGGGLTRAELSALDGAGNSWITNYTSGAGSVSEFANSGVALSPATTGFAHVYYGAYGVAIDPSGNVWVGNNVAYTSAATATRPAGGFVTEIVGAAVPVITPISAGLPTTAGGTSKLGTAPQ